jgi:diguanylate cyclase (GGDEF)-like protein
MTRYQPRARTENRTVWAQSFWDIGVALVLVLLGVAVLLNPLEWPFGAAALISAPLTCLIVLPDAGGHPLRRPLIGGTIAVFAAGALSLLLQLAPTSAVMVTVGAGIFAAMMAPEGWMRGASTAMATALLISFMRAGVAAPALHGLVICLVAALANEARLWAVSRDNIASLPDVQSRLHRASTASLPEVSELQRSSDTLVTQAIRAMRDQTENVVDLMLHTLDADDVSVFWFHSSDRTATLQVARPARSPVSLDPVSTAGGLLGRARKSTDLVVAHDELLSDDATPGGWTPRGNETGSVWAIGFFDAGIPLGALVIEFAERRAPTDGQREIARAAGMMLADSARNARIMHEVDQARAEIQVVRDTAQELSRTLSVDEVGATTFQLVQRIVDVDCLFITQWSESGDQTVVYSHSQSAEVANWMGRVVENSEFHLVALAVARRQVLPYRGGVDDPAEVFGDAELSVPARALAVFPLIVGDRILGTATVGTPHLANYSMLDRDRMGTVMAYLGAVLTNAFDYTEALVRANVDGMTGLLNHRSYKERGSEALARAVRGDRSLVIMLTDIDFFKKVNDTHGHAKGDDVLKAVARVLRDNVRKTDVAARYGGEEFAIVLEDSPLDSAHTLAERIRTDVAALRFDGSEGEFNVTLSIGIAAFPGDGEELATLAEAADRALYHAKRNGRNQTVIYRRIRQRDVQPA